MAEQYTQTISTSEFTETPRLLLEQATGDVHIEGWDRPEIEVSGSDDDENFEVDQSGSQVIVRNRPIRFGFENLGSMIEPAVRELENLGMGLEKGAARIERQVARQLRHATHRMRHMEGKIDLGRWAGGHDYYIKVPHNCDLTLRTSTGDLSVMGVNGTFYIQTSSGDTVLERLSGNLLVSSASGEIHANGIDGKVGVRSASGDLVFRRARLQEISISTASGDIELDLLSVPERAFEVKTVSGDVRVELPPDARLSVEVTTFSGDIHCDFPHERTRRRPGRTTDLTINGGGIQAHFSSVSGDVSIDRGSSFVDAPSVREDAPVAREGGEPTMDLSRAQSQAHTSEDLQQAEEDRQRAEADRRQADADRKQAELEILQAVERGELSPQDALSSLSSLDQ